MYALLINILDTTTNQIETVCLFGCGFGGFFPPFFMQFSIGMFGIFFSIPYDLHGCCCPVIVSKRHGLVKDIHVIICMKEQGWCVHVIQSLKFTATCVHPSKITCISKFMELSPIFFWPILPKNKNDLKLILLRLKARLQKRREFWGWFPGLNSKRFQVSTKYFFLKLM